MTHGQWQIRNYNQGCEPNHAFLPLGQRQLHGLRRWMTSFELGTCCLFFNTQAHKVLDKMQITNNSSQLLDSKQEIQFQPQFSHVQTYRSPTWTWKNNYLRSDLWRVLFQTCLHRHPTMDRSILAKAKGFLLKMSLE